MRRLTLICTALFAVIGLTGCDPADLPPAQIPAICKALDGPIKYNSTNIMSKRYAAALLAMDLRERNLLGRRLGCPQYKSGG